MPTFQRFVGQDPIEFGGGGPNVYAYAQDDPANLTDPLGTCPRKCAPSGKAPSPSRYQEWGQSANWLQNYLNVYEFHRGGSLDAQAYGGSKDYANYVFGVYMAGAGYSLSATLNGANDYAHWFSHYPPQEPMDPNYPSTPASNVADITRGFNDEKNGTLCTPQ